MRNDVRARVVAVPMCRPARPAKGASIVRRALETWRLRMEEHHSQVEIQRLRMAAPHFRMETPLRGRSGGHTGTAPTIPLGQTSKNNFETCPKLGKR